MGAITRGLADLKENGTMAGQLEGMQTREELYSLVGYKPGTAWEF